MNHRKFLVVAATALLSLALDAQASTSSVAYINSVGGSVDYLSSYGYSVTYLNNPAGLTLGDLSGFDAVIVASNAQFSEPTNIGNVVGAFADAGGGVVLTEFVFQGIWALGGAIMDSNHSPFTIDPISGGYSLVSGLGTIYDPSSPLFSGVNQASVSTQFQALVGLNSGADLIADWSSGRHAFGVMDLGSSSVVALNLFPDASYTSDSDTQHLIANAIGASLEGNGPSVPEPGTLSLCGLALAGLVRARRGAFRTAV